MNSHLHKPTQGRYHQMDQVAKAKKQDAERYFLTTIMFKIEFISRAGFKYGARSNTRPINILITRFSLRIKAVLKCLEKYFIELNYIYHLNVITCNI